jgi:hypothetical protein
VLGGVAEGSSLGGRHRGEAHCGGAG